MSAARNLSLETLMLDQDGRVLTARFSSPPLSFVTPALVRDLDRLTVAVDRDDSVGAVVLTGAEDGRFMTHADPGDMSTLALPQVGPAVLEQALRVGNLVLRIPGLVRTVERHGGAAGAGLLWVHRWKRTTLRMNRSSTVYLAAVNGPAMGGGQELTLACDLRYAADAEYIRMGQMETLAGLIPGGGGTQRLPSMLGTTRALEHMLEGRPVTAQEALELGIVQRLVAPDRLLAETQETAARLARRSPVAIRALKRSVYFANNRPLRRGLDYELAGFLAAASTRAMTTRTLPTFLGEITRLGDTPFLADPEPWIDGTKVDQVT
ncbi:enoyl-CoA hydratase/isomerase family protein [Streptomyces mirabilis]|uniref:enoyl-CoA hydratase/isomerase family protein n=1 Tax=Streptomyces mirabilis TaxID=68239 RepID=UPI0033FB1771